MRTRQPIIVVAPEGLRCYALFAIVNPRLTPWATVFRPSGAGLPRCRAMLLSYCLAGGTDVLLRGDTDVTPSLSGVHRPQPGLRHGPRGVGELVPAGVARRPVRPNRPEPIPAHPAVLRGRRVDAGGRPGRRAGRLR